MTTPSPHELPGSPTDAPRPVPGPSSEARVAARKVGRLHVVRELARGGMGVVYLAWDPHLRLQRAVKVLLGEAYASQEQTERFQREARVLARLRHPNIIAVLEAGFDGAHPYLVLPFVEGGSLAQRLSAHGPLEPREAADLVGRVASAIDYAHAEGVVHRDLKPANILLDAGGAPLVTDFGIAGDLEARERLTRTGQLLGTPAYMPPEQAAGEREHVGPRADVYSLGAILYELLSGAPPFSGSTPLNVVKAILTDAPRPLRALRPDAPRDLEAVVAQAMAKAPERRYDSAAALAADLRRFLEGRPVAARSLSPLARAGRAVARRPLLAIVPALAGLALSLGLATTAAGQRAAARLDQAERLTSKARAARAEGDLEAAAGLLRRALALAPEASAPAAALAWLELDRGHPDAAGPLVEQLTAAHPGDALSLALSGALSAARGDDAAAADAYSLALALEPADVAVRVRAAQALARLGRHADAEAALGDADAPDAERVRATCLVSRGAERSAEAAWWRVLRADPGDGPALAGVVDLRLAQDDVTGLSRLWEEVHQRLSRPRDPSLQRLTRGDLPDIVADLQGGAPLARLRAALAAPLFLRSEVAASLAASAAAPGALGEVARAGLVVHRRASLGAWAQAAGGLEAPLDAAPAISLLEMAPRLTPAEVAALEPLRQARGERLRAALVLALAVRATRDGGGGADGWAAARLRALEDDPAAAVRARAAAARRALEVWAGLGDLTPAATRLALALVDLPDEPAPDLEATRARLLAADVVTQAPALLLRRARASLEAGRPGAARADVDRALALAPDHAHALGLLAQLGRGEERARALAALAARDPVAAEEAAARAAAARALGAWVLPGPGGAARLVWTPGALVPDAGADAAPFTFHAWRQELSDGALVLHGSVRLHARFAVDPVQRVEVHLRQEIRLPEGADVPGVRVRVVAHASADDEDGRWFRVTDDRIDHGSDHRVDHTFTTRAGGVPPAQRALRVVVRRGLASTWTLADADDGAWRRAVDGPLAPRRSRGQQGLELDVFATRQRVQRVVVEGLLMETVEAGPPGAPPRLSPLAGARLQARRLLPGDAAPVDLAALRASGLDLRLGAAPAPWVAGMNEAPMVVVPGLRGDLRLAARVSLDPFSEAYAGVALRSGDDRLFLALGGPIVGAAAPGSIHLLEQRGTEWEAVNAMSALADLREGQFAATLTLERRGEWVIARWGAGERATVATRFVADEPLEACLVLRRFGGGAPCVARFRDVEVLVAPDRDLAAGEGAVPAAQWGR